MQYTLSQSDIIEMDISIFTPCVLFCIILSFYLCLNLCKIFALRSRPMQLQRCPWPVTVEGMVSYRSRVCLLAEADMHPDR